MGSTWQRPPVWVHGDMAVGNLLCESSKLTAIIDFGCMGVGDPACDLVLAWTLFDEASRAILRQKVALDAETWARAKGWALWKAAIEMVKLGDNTPQKEEYFEIIKKLLADYA